MFFQFYWIIKRNCQKLVSDIITSNIPKLLIWMKIWSRVVIQFKVWIKIQKWDIIHNRIKHIFSSEMNILSVTLWYRTCCKTCSHECGSGLKYEKYDRFKFQPEYETGCIILVRLNGQDFPVQKLKVNLEFGSPKKI